MSLNNNNTLSEMEYQTPTISPKSSKNKLILIIAFIILIASLLLLSLFYPKNKSKTVNNLDISEVLVKSNVSQVLASTPRTTTGTTTDILSDYQGDYYLTNDKTLILKKIDGSEVEIAKNVGANTGFKLDLDKKRLFYRSDMDGTVVDLTTGEKKTLHGLMNTYFTDNYTVFSVMKDDGKTYLYLGDSPTPIMEGSCLVVSTLAQDKIAVLDVDFELNYPMPGYLKYDDKQQATDLKLVKIDLSSPSKQYAPITLANSDRGSVNIAGNIIYQDNNNQTKINNGESEISINRPISLQTLTAVPGTNSALYADVSRENKQININRINLLNGDTKLMGKYLFKDSIYNVETNLPTALQDKLNTPVSKVFYEKQSKSFVLAVGDNYLSLPATVDPENNVAIKTNNFKQLTKRFIENPNKEFLLSQNNHSNQVLGDEDSKIPSECIEKVSNINKDTSEEEARNLLDEALKCFGAYSDVSVQSLDITTPIALDSSNNIVTLASTPDVIDKLIALVKNGKSFQIKKTANQFTNKDKLPLQAAQAIQFVREKTNFSLSDVYNDNIKVRNFFDNRQKYNLIDYTRNLKIDYIFSNLPLVNAETSGPFPCDAPSGQCISHDGVVTDSADPTIIDNGTTGWCRAGEVFTCKETIPANPTINTSTPNPPNSTFTPANNNNPTTPTAIPTTPTINPTTPGNNTDTGTAV